MLLISYCDDDDDDIKINKVSNLVIVSIVSSPIQLFSWFSCIFSIFRYVLSNIWKMIIIVNTHTYTHDITFLLLFFFFSIVLRITLISSVFLVTYLFGCEIRNRKTVSYLEFPQLMLILQYSQAE